MRARTRRFDHVFVLGLEEGSLPRRGGGTPFLDEDARRDLDTRGARLLRADPVSRDRYLFYTACTRATKRLTLVREAASDEGSPREPSPFWDEVARAVRARRGRALDALAAALGAHLAARGRAHRARAAARARRARAPSRAATRSRARTAGSAGSTARAAPSSGARGSRNPLVLEQLGARTTFNVTELERFADCSSAWFVERLLSPRTIDAEVDPKLRGSVAHTALHRFFAGPAEGARDGARRAGAGRGGGALHARVPRRGARGRAAWR